MQKNVYEQLNKMYKDYQKVCELLTYEEIILDKNLCYKYEREKLKFEPIAKIFEKYQNILDNIIEFNELKDYYPEFEKIKGECKYDNCYHLREPECAVRKAVKAGDIHILRYKAYVANMEEIKNKNKY